MPRWPVRDLNATTKICAKCKSTKPLSDFSLDKGRRDRKFHSCKACVQVYMADRWRNNPDHRAKQQSRSAELYRSVEGRARALWRAAQERRPEGFTLTLAHVVAGIERGVCPVTGIKFDMTDSHQVVSGRFRNPYGPSLDRVDGRLGYTNENSRIVVTQYNIMRGELSDDETFYLCRLIASRHS